MAPFIRVRAEMDKSKAWEGSMANLVTCMKGSLSMIHLADMVELSIQMARIIWGCFRTVHMREMEKNTTRMAP